MDKKRGLAFLFLCLFSTLPFIPLSTAVSAASQAGNTWQKAAPVPEAVLNGGTAVVQGKIYVMGGSVNCQYDPAMDAWTTKTPMPTPRTLFGMAVWQDKIYVVSGASGFDWTRGGYILSDAVEVYDPSTDTWQIKQSIPTARNQLQANAVNGQIYLVGGRNGGSGEYDLNEVYNVTSDSWITQKPIPYSVASYASTVCGGKIYIMGGQNIHAMDANVNYVQIYDCANNSWSFGAPMPTAVECAASGATTGVASLRRIYVVGGEASNCAVLGVVQVYDPQNNTWTFGASMPSTRHSLGIAVVGDRLYAIGGDPNAYPGASYDLVGNRVWYTHNEVYTPFGYGTPDPTYVFEHTPPRVLFVPSFNGTYTNSTVPLVFSVDKTVDWVGYSLDGQQNITINGNATLTGLPNGQHNITVYANDTFGNTAASETVNFTIAKPEPFPTVNVIAVSGAIAMIMVAGLLVYFKKHRRAV